MKYFRDHPQHFIEIEIRHSDMDPYKQFYFELEKKLKMNKTDFSAFQF